MGEEPLFDPCGTDKEPNVRIECRASNMRGYHQNEEALEHIIRRGGWCIFLPIGRTDR